MMCFCNFEAINENLKRVEGKSTQCLCIFFFLDIIYAVGTEPPEQEQLQPELATVGLKTLEIKLTWGFFSNQISVLSCKPHLSARQVHRIMPPLCSHHLL